MPVARTEWEIDPNVDVEAGAALPVRNEGTQDHDDVVVGTKERTSLVEAGSSQGLRLDGRAPGTCKVVCSVAGHESSGMRSEPTVRAAGTGGESVSQTEAAEHAAPHPGG